VRKKSPRDELDGEKRLPTVPLRTPVDMESSSTQHLSRAVGSDAAHTTTDGLEVVCIFYAKLQTKLGYPNDCSRNQRKPLHFEQWQGLSSTGCQLVMCRRPGGTA
jgi:hypothetical protein